MHIVVFAAPEVCDELTSALDSRGVVERVWDEGTFDDRLRSGNADLVAIDPSHIRADLFERLLAMAYTSPCAVIIYTSLTRETATRIFAAAHRDAVEVVLRGQEESGEALKARVELAAAGSVASRFLQRLVQRFGLRVGTLAEGVVGLFCGEPLPISVHAMAASVQLPVRSFARAIVEAGIASPLRLLECARILRYYQDVHELPHHRSRRTTFRQGKVSIRSARDILKRVGAPSPRNLSKLDVSEFLQLLEAYLLR
jgi:hypothetical protein